MRNERLGRIQKENEKNRLEGVLDSDYAMTATCMTL